MNRGAGMMPRIGNVDGGKIREARLRMGDQEGHGNEVEVEVPEQTPITQCSVYVNLTGIFSSKYA